MRRIRGCSRVPLSVKEITLEAKEGALGLGEGDISSFLEIYGLPEEEGGLRVFSLVGEETGLDARNTMGVIHRHQSFKLAEDKPRGLFMLKIHI
jgi:hypothetical protein